MFTVSNLLRTHKGSLTGIDIRVAGGVSLTKELVQANRGAYGFLSGKSLILKGAKKFGVRSWEAGGHFSIACCSSAEVFEHLTVANLCGTCVNKNIFITINGAEKKHIYSVHPVKDSKAVRRWWIDSDMVLHIQTWLWNIK
ncbi:MAG: hypothetical protein K2O18_05190 [Oscillospiraceae bacterium]|nr:hypothetical protein [Oscillospiraceae bacterium]